ncbi:MAG: PAS domain-containing protein [Pseudomonadota bacterium]
MKNNTVPSAVERVMREDDFIVSKTDLTGRILYGNRIFIEFSGYTERELLGAQHNIIRHPDMPRGVFKLLWDTIQAKEECFAYVKNMAKDGSFYWVYANVTPNYGRDGQVTGYFSVRRKPSAEGVRTLAEIYRAMLDIERKAGPRDACTASLAFLNQQLSNLGKTYAEFVVSL